MMQQPYYLLTLLMTLAGGIALGIVWCKSYGYIQYNQERKPPDLQQPRVCPKLYAKHGLQPSWDDDALLHEAQMMRDAQIKQKQGGDSE